jgi:hypothetical protein
MRPKAIIYFERILIGMLILGVGQLIIGWERAIQAASLISSFPTTYLIISGAFGVILRGALIYLVSRRRSKVAMWILVAAILLGVPAEIATMASGLLVGSSVITASIKVGELAGLSLLFTPGARAWMDGKLVDPLRDTFS